MKEIINGMKPSTYNRYIAKNGVCLVFNSCSLSLIKLDEDRYSFLQNGDLSFFNENELQKLFEMNFVNSFTDESKNVIEQHYGSNYSDNKLRLTIFTTTCCNARCYYCFQKGAKRLVPSTAVEQNIVKLIDKNRDKSIHIKWFGGEPLLNVGMIDRISSQLDALGIEFSSSMISNGYLIGQYVDKIPTWRLKRIQITLDGINEKYNSVKNYMVTNDSNPFKTVISGIKKLLSIGVFVSIRLNFDKNNIQDILDCIYYLHREIGNPPNLSIYGHNIFGPEESYHLSNGTNLYLPFMKALMECGYIDNLFQLGIRYRPLPCSAYSPHFYVIDTQGTLLKCEHYTLDSYSSGIVGNLEKGIYNTYNLDFWLNRKYPYEKCIGCEYLPICQGGCRYESMGGTENGSCLPYRDCLNDLLYEYYLMKVKGLK